MHCNREKNHESEVSQDDLHTKRRKPSATKGIKRRDFIKGASTGLLGTVLSLNSPFAWAKQLRSAEGTTVTPATKTAKVSLVKGDSRYDNAYKSLKMIEQDIKAGIGNKQVVLKPNNVVVDRQLAATHVDCLAAILDVLKPICQKPIIIAESPADGSAEVGFENYGYKKLLKEYNVQFRNLDKDKPATFFILSRNLQPMPILMSSMMMDPDIYLISAAVMKTHDTVVATLSLKNTLMAAPLKTKEANYKGKVHQGIKEINYSFFLMAQRMKPSLAVIDGFQGMEGNGPIDGEPMDAKVAVASTDFLAADRVSVEVMGIDFSTIGYLNYCADANMGVADLSKMEIMGENIENCRMQFRLHENVENLYKWMEKT
jgi:uncharacterized protein (DUF362 family)